MELDSVSEHMLSRVLHGDLTGSDAALAATFGAFLRETPKELRMGDLANAPDYFSDRIEYEDWRARWLPFLLGFRDGPTTPEEYAHLRPKLFRASPDIDSFHT